VQQHATALVTKHHAATTDSRLPPGGNCSATTDVISYYSDRASRVPVSRAILLVLWSPSHGENRGSSPLGSANEIKTLDKMAVSSVPVVTRRVVTCLLHRVLPPVLRRSPAARPLNALNARSCLVDGEPVACDNDGLAVFERSCPWLPIRPPDERWPGTVVTLRQGARVIEDNRRVRTA
jgi:hypothetical protein